MQFDKSSERGFLFAPTSDDSLPSTGSSTTDQSHGGFAEPEIPTHLREDPLRRAVVDRLRLAAVRHCRHVAELVGTARAVGPHGIMFFYADPETRENSSATVRLASRLFFQGPEVVDALKIIRILNGLAYDYRYSAFDPRIHLSNRVEEMRRDARFVGVGVTTVLPPRRQSVKTRPDVLGLDRPHQGLAVLRDGAEILLRGSASVGQVDVQSTHNLDHKGRATHNWRWAPLHGNSGDPTLRAAYDALAELRDIITNAEDEPQFLERVPVRLSASRSRRRAAG